MSRLETFPRWFLYRTLFLIQVLIVAFFAYEATTSFESGLAIVSLLVFIIGGSGSIILMLVINDKELGYVRALTTEEEDEKNEKKKLKATKKERNLKWKELMEIPTSEWDDKRRCSKCGSVMYGLGCTRIWADEYGCNKRDKRQVAKQVASSMVLNTYTDPEESRDKRIQMIESEIDQYDNIINNAYDPFYSHL